MEGAYYNGELLIAILIKREIKFSFSKKIRLKKIEMNFIEYIYIVEMGIMGVKMLITVICDGWGILQ